MSMPNIPNINPIIDLEMEGSINMILSSIAMEEIGLSHIINAEAEKVQYIVGTLKTACQYESAHRSIDDLLRINNSVDKTLKGVLKNQMMLHMKFEDAIDLYREVINNDFERGIRCDVEYDKEEC